jgi:hypothetical protein
MALLSQKMMMVLMAALTLFYLPGLLRRVSTLFGCVPLEKPVVVLLN